MVAIRTAQDQNFNGLPVGQLDTLGGRIIAVGRGVGTDNVNGIDRVVMITTTAPAFVQVTRYPHSPENSDPDGPAFLPLQSLLGTFYLAPGAILNIVIPGEHHVNVSAASEAEGLLFIVPMVNA